MGIGLVKGKSSVFVTEEITEGTFVAPSSAADALEVLEDGLETDSSREVIERNTLSDSVEAEKPRLGVKTVTATFPCELKAAGSEGEPPPFDRLMRSLLGATRDLAAPVTSKSSGHTSTSIKIEDADIADFVVNGVYLFKVAGAYEIRPVSAVITTPGSAAITLAFALKNGAPSGAVVIAKMTQYHPGDTWPTVSGMVVHGGEIQEKLSGLRAISASVDNWTTGQVPAITFSTEGTESDRVVGTAPYSPDFSADALPPVLLDACAYLGGVEIDYNEFSLSIENTKADIPSACKASGKAGTRVTGLAISGSINPYMEDDDVARWDAFEAGSDTSLLVFAFNQKASPVAGEFRQAVAIWMPKITITELPVGDQDGVLTDAIAFQAFKNAGGDSIFATFI